MKLSIIEIHKSLEALDERTEFIVGASNQTKFYQVNTAAVALGIYINENVAASMVYRGADLSNILSVAQVKK